jgi:mannose-1-phosphate guanylyltransferase
VETGDIISIKSKDSFIYSPDKLTAVVGMKNVVIINLDDALLVADMDKSESVKKVVDFLSKNNMIEYM